MVEAPSFAVVKIGGALLSDAARIAAFWDGVRVLLEDQSVVVVHGGGPQSTAMARRLGHEPRIVQGRRVTTDLDLQILRWTVRGALNSELVATALAAGVPAVGISGVDGATVSVSRRPPWEIGGEMVDFGWVGDVQGIDTRLPSSLCSAGYVPVVAPLGTDGAGQTFNVNADTVARSIAEALSASHFLLVTEAGGIRRDPDDVDTVLSAIDFSTYEEGVSAGWIAGGMLVKLRVAFEAFSSGIPDVHILAPEDVVTRSGGTRIVS